MNFGPKTPNSLGNRHGSRRAFPQCIPQCIFPRTYLSCWNMLHISPSDIIRDNVFIRHKCDESDQIQQIKRCSSYPILFTWSHNTYQVPQIQVQPIHQYYGPRIMQCLNLRLKASVYKRISLSTHLKRHTAKSKGTPENQRDPCFQWEIREKLKLTNEVRKEAHTQSTFYLESKWYMLHEAQPMNLWWLVLEVIS